MRNNGAPPFVGLADGLEADEQAHAAGQHDLDVLTPLARPYENSSDGTTDGRLAVAVLT